MCVLLFAVKTVKTEGGDPILVDPGIYTCTSAFEQLDVQLHWMLKKLRSLRQIIN